MDPVAWVIAATGAFSAITAWWLSKRAQKDREVQTTIANKVASDKVHLDETQQALDAYEKVNVMHQREIDRMSEQNNLLADLLKSEREHSAQDRRGNAILIDRYRSVVMELLQALLTLKDSGPDNKAIDNALTNATLIMKNPIVSGRRSDDPDTGELRILGQDGTDGFRIDEPPTAK